MSAIISIKLNIGSQLMRNMGPISSVAKKLLSSDLIAVKYSREILGKPRAGLDCNYDVLPDGKETMGVYVDIPSMRRWMLTFLKTHVGGIHDLYPRACARGYEVAGSYELCLHEDTIMLHRHTKKTRESWIIELAPKAEVDNLVEKIKDRMCIEEKPGSSDEAPIASEA